MSASKAFSPSAEPEVLALDDYLRRLGLDRFTPLPPAPCELCGGREATQLRETVAIPGGLRARIATMCCHGCGLIRQEPRFAPGFYAAYYAHLYRRQVSGAARPSAAYIADQVARGAALLDSLAAWLPQTGRLLDIGCGAGGMLAPFLAAGWHALGIDPDRSAIAEGLARGYPLRRASAETVTLDRAAFDLIVITGSLEHVRDANAVLRRCHDAGAPGSLLLLEAHGLGQAAALGAIGANHRRLLTGSTMALLMLRHGWQIEWITAQPLCGSTRPGSTFALGRRIDRPVENRVAAALARGARETPEAIAALLDALGIE